MLASTLRKLLAVATLAWAAVGIWLAVEGAFAVSVRAFCLAGVMVCLIGVSIAAEDADE